jgi:hypothetical protein
MSYLFVQLQLVGLHVDRDRNYDEHRVPLCTYVPSTHAPHRTPTPTKLRQQIVLVTFYKTTSLRISQKSLLTTLCKLSLSSFKPVA